MNTNINIQEFFTVKLKNILKNRNILIFIFFFLISAFLWFLNKLNKEYIVDYDVSIKYIKIPDKDKLSQKPNQNLKISLKGHGYSILQLKLKRFNPPFVVDLSENILSRINNDKFKQYVLTKSFADEINRSFGNNLELISINPDTLFFIYEPIFSKKVPIKINAAYNIPNDMLISGKPIISPDSVLLLSKYNIIDSIIELETEYKNLGTINNLIEYKLSLVVPNDIRISHNSVKMKVPMEKAIDKTIELTIKPENFPEHYKVIFIPDKVKISFRVPMSQFDKIDQSHFNVIADYNNRKANQIYIAVKNSSHSIANIKSSPDNVYFLLERL